MMKHSPSGARFSLALVLVLTMLSAARGPMFPGQIERIIPLFAVSGEEFPASDAGGAGVIRSRPVSVNPLFFEEGRIEPGTKIEIALFGRRPLFAVLRDSGKDINGVLSFRAAVEGSDFGFVLLSASDGLALGVVEVPERRLRFEIVPDMERGWHVLREIDPAAAQRSEKDDAPPLIPPPLELGEVNLRTASATEYSTVSVQEFNVDLMIVYTPAAASYASGIGGINLVINQAWPSTRITPALTNRASSPSSWTTPTPGSV